MLRLRVRLRALGALLVLLGLVVGVPAALALTIGDPTAHWSDLTAGDVTDAVLIDVLAAVAWLAWAQFAIATAIELLSALRRTPMPRRIPGVLPSQQQLARVLVTAVLLLGPTIANTVLPTAMAFGADLPPAPPVSTSFQQTSSTTGTSTASKASQPVATPTINPARAATMAQAASRSHATTVTVAPAGQGPGTYWDLAAEHLGDGQRWQEIWHLNEGRTQADGSVMDSAGRLRPGWTVLIPNTNDTTATRPTARTDHSDAARTQDVTVQPGDTLSELAAEHGQPEWQQTWHANAGRTEPDGVRFTDPDLVMPGWKISIPAAAPDEQAAPVAPAEPAAPPVEQPTSPRADAPTAPAAEPTVPTAPAVPAAPVVPAAPAPPASTSAPSVPSEAAQPAQAAPIVPRTAGDDSASVDGDDDTDAEAEGWSVPAVAFAGGGTLAAVLLAALVAMRRQRFRERRPGATISSTPPELAAMEKALLTGNAHAVADVQFLHEALSSLLRTLDDGAELPDVVAVRLSATVLELVLTAERRDAPAPWRVDETGLRWSIDTDADLSAAGQPGPAELAPYPALVTVGYSGAGEHYLVDLERVGAISLTGDPERCEDLARYLAAELAHNRWSEQLQVSVVGFGAELAELNPSRILYRRDVASAVASLRSALAEHSEVLAASHSTVLAGRARLDLPGDGWAPHVLLVAPGAPHVSAEPDGLAELLEAMRAERSRAAVAIVLAGDTQHAEDTRWALHVDKTGRLSIPALKVELVAHRLPASEATKLGALLAQTAAAPNVTEPRARGHQPWDAFADAVGAPLPGLTEQRPNDDWTLKSAAEPDEQVGAIASVLPMPASAYLTVTATTSADVEQLAPGVGAVVRRRVEQADPDLDADLAVWHDGDSGAAKLALLGPVSLVGAGPTPAKRAAFLTEMVAYLAARPLGVSPAQLTADFWPGGDDTGTGRKMISKVRTWLGEDPRTGALYVPMARDAGSFGSYRIQGLLVDGDLFRRLRLRGVTRGADGISDLWAALELVRGEPLLELQAKGCGWLVDTPLQHEYTAGIVDVAHLVATHHLAAGEPEQAERAARIALLAGAPDDVPLLDLVAACDAAGRQAEADNYVRQILANNEVDVEEELHPRTYEVLSRRSYLPRPPTRATSGG